MPKLHDPADVAKKPEWLKTRLHRGGAWSEVRRIVEQHGLHTICSSGRCPNQAECWSRRTATFLILGDICTRSCRFCATPTGRPAAPDAEEPRKVARSVALMGLRHAVVTSVTRDDLPDGGAAHWAATVEAIRSLNPDTAIELLIPDFDARTELLDAVLASNPDIVGHNIETVERLTPQVRSRARYRTSLATLRYLSEQGARTKSGLMLGLGERDEEVIETLHDLRRAGVRIVTLGQYLRPTLEHYPVAAYIAPEQFEAYRLRALEMGFEHCASAPLVRSSYRAEAALEPSEGAQLMKVLCRDLGTMDYPDCRALQQTLFDAALERKRSDPGRDGDCAGTILLVEHPPVYTLGKSGRLDNLLVSTEALAALGAQLFRIDRGGDITFHGPGQLVCYPILDLERIGLGLRSYIEALEEAVIRTVAHYGIDAGRIPGASGVWIDPSGRCPRKICAIGVRSSRYITMHGFALNVATDLRWFGCIHPCGFRDRGTASIESETGRRVCMDEVKQLTTKNLSEILNVEIYK